MKKLIALCALLLQGGLKAEKPKAEVRVIPGLPWHKQALQPLQALSDQPREIFSGQLLKTTVLLQFIWLTNGLAYYGLVLLTTSVNPLSSCSISFCKLG